jgi:hypothetical protein
MILSFFLNSSECDRTRAWVYESGGAYYEVLRDDVNATEVQFNNDTKFIPKPVVTTNLDYYIFDDELRLTVKISKTHSKNRNGQGNPFQNPKSKKNRIVEYREMQFILNQANTWTLKQGCSKNDCEKIDGEYVPCGFLITNIEQMLISSNWDNTLPSALQYLSRDQVVAAICPGYPI